MSDTLAARPCVACRKDATPIAPEAAAALLLEIPGWEVVDDGRLLQRRYEFDDFAGAFGFVSQVAALAEAADHHPDLEFGWGYVRVSLQTHSIGGLHENDFILAARIQRL